MGKSRFIELMAKSIGKSATKEELLELEIFLEQFPEYRKTQDVAHALKLETKQPKDILRGKDLNAGLARLWDSIGEIEKPIAVETTHPAKKKALRTGTLSYLKWAAAAVVLMVCLTGIYNYSAQLSTDLFLNKTVMHSIYVPFGKTRELVLPDGTRVKLNAGSTLTYPQLFSKTDREVSLKGEGFFEVTKNPKKPFLVITDHLTIKVLGTVFNVKAYADDKNIETTLLKGKVQVELKDIPEKKIILLPNEKLIVMNESPGDEDPAGNREAKIEYQLKKLPNIKPEEIKETAWLSNRMVFINENFEEVAKQLERKYDVQMIFEDQALKTEQLSGVLEQESLESALDIIKMTTPFKFKIDKSVIHISHK
jgi:transmembrane sensor